MATDVFSREVSYGGAFSADGVEITFTGFTAGMLVQNIQWQYQQAVTRLYEVGSPDLYLVAGRTQGQCTVARVLGPTPILPSFYESYGDVCNAEDNSLDFSAVAACGTNGGASAESMIWSMHHVVLVQIGGSVSAQDMIINESMVFMYLWLSLSDGSEPEP